jgi:hypothetical protein
MECNAARDDTAGRFCDTRAAGLAHASVRAQNGSALSFVDLAQ